MTLASKLIRPTKVAENMAEDVRHRVASYTNEVRHDLEKAGEVVSATAQDAAASVSDRLKSVGVDTDALSSAAKENASQLQQYVMNEMRSRPMRALAVAAAVGLLAGLVTAR